MSESLVERHAGQPAGHDFHFIAINDVGPQVDVAAFHRTVAPGRRARQRDDRLGDVVARIGDDQLAEFCDLRPWLAVGPISMP